MSKVESEYRAKKEYLIDHFNFNDVNFDLHKTKNCTHCQFLEDLEELLLKFEEKWSKENVKIPEKDFIEKFMLGVRSYMRVLNLNLALYYNSSK
ncbi:MAG: hypothetical protein ACFFCV_07145 [Promethearchaeota archaeon]